MTRLAWASGVAGSKLMLDRGQRPESGCVSAAHPRQSCSKVDALSLIHPTKNVVEPNQIGQVNEMPCTDKPFKP